MRNSKHGLKALIVGIMVVLGAMALAAGAQAQTHEENLYLEHEAKLHTELLVISAGQTHTELLTKEINHNKPGGVLNPNPLTHGAGSLVGSFLINLGAVLLATVAAKQLGTYGVLLVAGRSLEIRCTGLELNTGKIDSSTDALGEATFKGCKSFDHKTLAELTNCQLKELETIKAKALVLPILHGPPTNHTEEPFVLFEPQGVEAEEPFTVVSYKPNLGCVLPLNNPVRGAVVALVLKLDAVTQLLLFSEGIQLLIGDLLTFGGFQSYITARATVELSGPHAGQKLGIH